MNETQNKEQQGSTHKIGIYLWIWGLLFVLSFFSYMVDWYQFQGLLRWSLILIFNKRFAENISELISKRYYIVPSFIVFFIISLVDTYLINIGTFPEEWRLSIRQPITNAVESLTVNPGFSNQTKEVNLIDRVQEFKDLYPDYSNLLIVDGGVKKEELESLRNLDVDIAVQGGAIFAK